MVGSVSGGGELRAEAQRTVTHSALMIPARAWAMGVQFLTSLILARLFEAAGFGRWGLILATAQWGYTFFIAWTSAALTRYGREEVLETGAMRTAFTARLQLLGPSVVVLLAAAGLGAPLLTSALGGSPALVALILAYTLTFTLSETVQYALPALGRSDLTALLTALEKTAVLGLIAVLASLGALSPESALGAFLVPPLVIGVAAIIRWRRAFFPVRRDRSARERYWTFCKPVLVTAPILGIVGWGDLFVIRWYAAFTDVGDYFLAYQFHNALTQICIVVTTVFNPFTVLLVVRGRNDLADLLVNRMQWVAWIAAVAAGCALTAAALPVFAFIAPGRFDLLVTTWLLLLPGGIATFMAAPASPIFTAKEDSLTPALVCASMMLVNIGLDVALIPHLGIRGAGVATTAGAVVLYAGMLTQLHRHGIRSRGVWSRVLLAFLPSLLLHAARPVGCWGLVALASVLATGAGVLAALQVRGVLSQRRRLAAELT